MSIASIALIILFGMLLFAFLSILFGWNLAEAITDFVEALFDSFDKTKNK